MRLTRLNQIFVMYAVGKSKAITQAPCDVCEMLGDLIYTGVTEFRANVAFTSENQE